MHSLLILFGIFLGFQSQQQAEDPLHDLVFAPGAGDTMVVRYVEDWNTTQDGSAARNTSHTDLTIAWTFSRHARANKRLAHGAVRQACFRFSTVEDKGHAPRRLEWDSEKGCVEIEGPDDFGSGLESELLEGIDLKIDTSGRIDLGDT